MNYRDRYDLPLSTVCERAAEQYRTGVDLLLSLWPGAAEALERAMRDDPGFALAYAARARLHAIRAQATEAKAMIAKASQLVETGSDRERSHVDVLSLAINGQASAALTAALQHIDQWPRDILIFALPLGAFGLLAFSGMADHDQARVDLCERYARHFAADDWWFLNYRGWAHGENGSLELGKMLVERSLESRRKNANAVHALAHVLHESGANDEAEWVISEWLPSYDRNGALHGHIAWHGALVALERGDTEKALGLYTNHVAPDVSHGAPINIISDTASFLWRMDAYGHVAPKRLWGDASEYAVRFFQQPGFAFADFHMAMLAAGAGHHDAVEKRAAELLRLDQQGSLVAGPMVPTLCYALQAFASQDYAACVQLLEPVAHEVVRMGGSGAQREVVEDTLLVAMMRMGETQKAKVLIDKRLHRRPSRRDSRWLEAL